MPPSQLPGRPPWLGRWRGDGIICRPTDPALARQLRRTKVPVVDLNDRHDDLGFPRIVSDNAAIGGAAARHLLERGFRRFAFCGFRREPWSRRRRLGFTETLQAAGFGCAVYESFWSGSGPGRGSGSRPNWACGSNRCPVRSA